MKKLIYSIIVFVVSIGLLVGGLELFSSYKPSISIHLDAPVQTKKSIVIHADQKKVWTILADVNHWAEWQSDIKNPELKGAFRPGHSFTWKSGGLNIRSDIQIATPLTKIGWCGPALGAFAVHIWTFTTLIDGSTRVDVEESMEGWLVSVLSHQFQTGLDTSLDKWLGALKATAEKQ
ncbi:SRPBCC family protein [Pedobacter cryoconitis]|uniref:Polyketide cyclase/dehydrase/lipid transport protein n=1 Tax=Pedobacter cryoconitis TaxID=188932 RepID=A0A7X0MIS5_9SPHI|nr:SRPBCC family protein [Pedobacter cryoconitis]MBB6498738.1 hypothetical protein [Pedobacter cryoconitis]